MQAEAEAKRLLAEAISKHGEVVIAEKLIKMLPQYAKKIAAPLSNIDSVKIIDTGSGRGAASYSQSITNTMTQIQEPLKELTGLDVSQLLTDLVNRGNTHTVVRGEVVLPGGIVIPSGWALIRTKRRLPTLGETSPHNTTISS